MAEQRYRAVLAVLSDGRTVSETAPRSRKVAGNGVVCVAWQQVSVGKQRAGQRAEVLVTDQVLQFWIGNELLKPWSEPAPAPSARSTPPAQPAGTNLRTSVKELPEPTVNQEPEPHSPTVPSPLFSQVRDPNENGYWPSDSWIFGRAW